MRSEDEQIRIEYAGKKLTLHEWSAETGLSYHVLYQRYVARKWSAEETLTTPQGKKGGRIPGRGSVEMANRLAAGSNWMTALRLAIVLAALRDYANPYYRTDVELFFRDEFEKLFSLDGKQFLERLTATA